MSIVDVIKYEGTTRNLVYKHPKEDFTTLSQLVVGPSQVALLVLKGEALDLFESGTYTMHTSNIPLLNKIVNLPFGGESPFHCEVYFINIAEIMAVKWGVGDIIFKDPKHGNYPFRIGANGEMSIKVSDPRHLILNLVGTEQVMDDTTVTNYFRTAITQEIKTILPQIFYENDYEIFDIEQNLNETALLLQNRVAPVLDDYGISIQKFWINNMNMPEYDPTYQRLMTIKERQVTQELEGELDIRQREIEAAQRVAAAKSDIEIKKMNINLDLYQQQQLIALAKHRYQELGYTWSDEVQASVMQALAENQGTGADIRNALLGAGMGLGMGSTIAGKFADIADGFFGKSGSSTGIGDVDLSGDFSLATDNPVVDLAMDDTPEEPKEPEAPKEDFETRVQKLRTMYDAGILTDEEFNKEKKKLLSEIR